MCYGIVDFLKCLIRTVKLFLQKVLGNSRIDDGEMPAVPKEIENVIKIPFSNGYIDKDTIEPLRPNNCTIVTGMFITA